ncbi:MAG TPA: hypothetical protein VIV58_03055 [Kofleriaceae bacterium]
MFALLIGCAGPRPTVGDVAVTASPVPGHVRVTGSLVNHGGHGTVEIHVALHGAATLRTDYTIDVSSGDRIALAFDVAAPAGDYTATLTAEYPD